MTANKRLNSVTKSDILDLDGSNNSVIYKSTLDNFQTKMVPSIMINDHKNLQNYSLSTLRFKKP